MWGIHRGPVNFPHKWPVTRRMFPFDDVIMVNWVGVLFLYQLNFWLTSLKSMFKFLTSRIALQSETTLKICSSWRLTSSLTRLFVLQLVQANNEENVKALHYWAIYKGNPLVTSGFPVHRTGDAESVPAMTSSAERLKTWQHHHPCQILLKSNHSTTKCSFESLHQIVFTTVVTLGLGRDKM